MEESQQEFKKKGLEAVITRIRTGKPSKWMFIIGVYRPPQAPHAWFDVFNDLILSIIIKGDIIILGDLNANLLKPNIYPASSLLQSFALASVQINHPTMTRIHEKGGSCLDVIALPETLECIEYTVSDKAASDHFPVQAAVRFGFSEKLKPTLKRSFKRTDINELKLRVQEISLDSNEHDCDELLNHWTQELNGILDILAPVCLHPMRKTSIPYMNIEIRGLQKHRDFLAKKLKNIPAGSEADAEEREELKASKQRVKSAIRRASKKYASNLLGEGNSRNAWRFIRETTFTGKMNRSTLLNVDDANTYFAQIVTASDESSHSSQIDRKSVV